MIWLLVALGAVTVFAVAIGAVNRVSFELSQTVPPALLRVDDAVEVVAEALPFEVSAAVSHDDVEEVISWVLDWFDELGMSSEFGEELGGMWVKAESAVADEIGAGDYAVARALRSRDDLDPVHVTVIVDEFLTWLRDIGAVGDAVE